jgi:hypothetical protein
MTKERTLNEFRQVKDSFYDTTKTKVINEYYRKVNFDCQYVVDLIKEYPNNEELGIQIRSYYDSLKDEKINKNSF